MNTQSNKKQSVKKKIGKGNDVVAVNSDLMAWLRENKVKTGVSITHFVTQAIEEKKERCLGSAS